MEPLPKTSSATTTTATRSAPPAATRAINRTPRIQLPISPLFPGPPAGMTIFAQARGVARFYAPPGGRICRAAALGLEAPRQQRRPDRSSEIAQRSHSHDRRVRVVEQVRAHGIGDPPSEGFAEANSKSSAE